MGAEKGCLAVTQDGQCIIGRQEAFYIYTPDGRGPCFVFEGGLKNSQAASSLIQAAWSLTRQLQVCRNRWPWPGSLLSCLPAVPGKERDAFPAAEGVSPSAAGCAWSGMSSRSVHSLLLGGSHAPHRTGSPVSLNRPPSPCLAYPPSIRCRAPWLDTSHTNGAHAGSNPLYVDGRQHGHWAISAHADSTAQHQTGKSCTGGLHFSSMKWSFIPVPAGRKSHLQRLRHYLVAVTVGAGATQALQIYDLTNKVIGSTLQLPQVRLHCHTERAARMRRQCAVGCCERPEWALLYCSAAWGRIQLSAAPPGAPPLPHRKSCWNAQAVCCGLL